MNCSFCPSTKREKEFMSVENFEHILKKVKLYTDYIYLHIKGEPLMHPDIECILNLCSKYNLMVNITTNGTLIYKCEKILLKSNIRQINISLHSNNSNLLQTIQTAKYISENSSTIIQFRLWNLKSHKDNSHIIALLESVFKINLVNETEKKNYKLKENVYLHFDYMFSWPKLNNKNTSVVGNCEGLKSQIGILVDGTIVPCCLDNDGDIALGNIYTEDLSCILLNSRATNIIAGFKKNTLCEVLCQRCTYVNR